MEVGYNNRKYYKNKYLIAFYDMDDQCVGVYDNISDICDSIKTEYNKTCSIIGHKLTKGGYCWLLGQPTTIHLIPVND